MELAAPQAKAESTTRVASLDAFRGFIMFSMLLGTFGLEKVSGNPVIGFLHTQLSHADWVGFHFEDLILPAFLFIIGISMGLSNAKRRGLGESYGERLGHAAKRAAILFGFGFILSWIGAKTPYFGPGVLQVLALSYFSAFLFINLSIPQRFGVFAGMLFIYWFFVFITPIPEVGRNSYVLFKNIVYLIDNRLTGSTTRWGYLYPTFTQAAVVVYGGVIGSILASGDRQRFFRILAIAGAIGILSGLALHPFIPIIKRMFTPSYTLLTCGLASLLLLAFYQIIDIRGYRKWSFFFVVFGANSIFVYLLNGLLSRWLMDTGGILLDPLAWVVGPWVFPLGHVVRLGVEWGICWWLFTKRIFFKI
ncbi:MAG: acyltransferase family protein [Candidatus Latescibacterota bacterium]